MKLLIASQPQDLHAMAVKCALEEQGHYCVLWFGADMPIKQTNTIYYSNNDCSYLLNETCHEFDAVWWRRPKHPRIPETLHSDDRNFVKKENAIFYESIPLCINNCWWINPFHAIKYASSKLYQLRLAISSGFNIPTTLISNSPSKIKDFICQNPPGNVIYKTFSSHHWFEPKSTKLSYTQPITLEQLPSDRVLQMTPGIFQTKLAKKYELRITCFGRYMVAVKIDSQQHPKGLTDWRMIPPQELHITPFTIDSSLRINIYKYMRKLGIVFGCFDFVVTMDDKLYFLEVNQQGQFLWIEELLPQLPMLDIFVKFIIQRSIFFEWQHHANALALKNYAQAPKLLTPNL